MMEIIERMIDADTFEEYKAGYGQTIITGYARVDIWAQQGAMRERLLKGTKKGGLIRCIYSDSADKPPIYNNCNRRKIALVFYRMLQVSW
jgi:acetyl-CoA carboxylase carboxyltransferase component